jgi:hypothetical protein
MERDWIELRRLENGRIVACWLQGGKPCDAASLTEEHLIDRLRAWPSAPLVLCGRAVVFAEKLWAEGFSLRAAGGEARKIDKIIFLRSVKHHILHGNA